MKRSLQQRRLDMRYESISDLPETLRDVLPEGAQEPD
jgi:hypothetical protein